MENMDRKEKNKKGRKGDDDVDDHYIGGKKGNGDGGVLSCENDFILVDNLEGKKKRKKKKDKGSKKERDECAVSGHAAENEGGDAYQVEMELGGFDVKNGGKGEVLLAEHGESKKIKRKKKKEKRSGKKRVEYQSSGHVVGNERSDTYLGETEIVSSEDKEGETGKVHEEHAVGLNGKTKKRKKDKRSSECIAVEQTSDADVTKKVEKKKRKLKKKQSKNDLGRVRIPDANCAEEDIKKDSKKKKRKREKVTTEDELGDVVVTDESLYKEVEVRRKKRKTEIKEGETRSKRKGKEKKIKQSENTKGAKDKKKVRFSSQVEVFPVSDSRNQKRKNKQDNLVRGKRFSTEEDKILQEAIDDYIEQNGLGEEGVDMVRNCRAHPKVKGCWTEIAKALPNRPQSAIYYRGQILLHRGENHKWSEEDCELLRKLQEKHGNKWKIIAEEFGRSRQHVKDTWRRLKVVNKQKGQWTQKEYQALFDLVNTDLRLKISEDEEKKSKYGMLRDNIHWTAISDTLETRTGPNCCMKWYDQLSSPMVTQGLWADSDDHRLINELFSVDASCMEDVDWDNILDYRSGDLCRKRWNQMVQHIGNHVSMSFSEQVEILAKRYCPDLIEVREAWENKPYVDDL
ncbi:hypothetical protein LIER_39992 [Lithospermum erythrorhizon]|uniref:Uncharacterized protein n=1 Tax=Lithospermum erythrorhizon TaxID=34254 RepID=A0AAV3QN79_LITER